MKRRNGHALVAEDDAQWCRFWQAYPKHMAKLDARKAWAQLAPTESTVEQMMDALAWQAGQPAWTKDGGEFVPYPASWLRSQRWTDERPQERRSPTAAWVCPHWEHCANAGMCESKHILGPARYPVKAVAS